MPETLLQTKLYLPPLRPNLVPRSSLIKRLNQGHQLGHKLTLISAPAGFGKTTLVSEWLAANERPAAWLSLDKRDNDPARFLTYLVATLQTLFLREAEGAHPEPEGNFGEGVLGMLQSPQPPPTESILTALLNEITIIRDNFVLVLDDYHVIDAIPIDDALTFLIEHQPPQMHLVIATREDPQLPLARYRARSQLTELRATDLRFTPAEAATFLNQVMGLGLSAGEVASLETRTEGWIAGLQLAALSMQGREDIPGFITAFAGDNRYIVDYLVEEVLQRQPENIRSFLLQTAILDRLSGPLCDAVRFGMAETPDHSVGETRSVGAAVTRREDGKGMLEALERGNLFVVPLDDRRQWYRYHHLFADVLQARLLEQQPEQVAILHQRASMWYEQEDRPADAIRHALAAQDFKRAADLAELAWPAWSGSFQSIAWLGWVKELPDEVVRLRPVLSVAYAWAYLNAGQLEAADAHLVDAERWLEPAVDMSDRPEILEMVVVDQRQFATLPATFTSARAYHAQAIGDLSGTVKYTQRLLDLLPEEDHEGRSTAAALQGLAYWAGGDIEAAHRALSDGLSGSLKAGNTNDLIVGAFVLAELKMILGHLHEAISTCKHALQLAADLGEPLPLGTEDVYTGMSELHRERGDLETAALDLATSKKLGGMVELPDWHYRWCIAQARLNVTLGDLDGALDLLREAERLYVRTPLPVVRPIAAMKARVWVRQGRLAEALAWARERGLSADDDLSYLREFEHITLAKLLIARYKSDREETSIRKAIGLLKRLLKAANEGARTGSVIEILVQQSLAYEAQGDIPSALVSLERALALAEPEGYQQIFVDEGQPMAWLLREAAKHGSAPNYVDQLRAAFGELEDPTPVTQPLIDPLSKRELEVLRLLGTELSGPEIAQELLVSLNTMRTHTKNIYGKLGVNNRRAAVRQAEELNLL